MYTLSKKIFRPKKQVFDNLQTGVYLVDSGIIQKLGFDEFNNICGICIYSKGDYIAINSSEYRPNCRYKALEDSALVKVDLLDIKVENLLNQLTNLEDLLLIKGFSLSLNPLQPSRFLHFAKWVKSKTKREDLSFLTHEDIATFLSSSRVTIARIITGLFNQGRVLKKKGRIERILHKRL